MEGKKAKSNHPEILWAPWRMEYIASTLKVTDCIFCTKPRDKKDKSNLILYRGKTGFIIMNRFPYNSGHLLIVPYRHTASFSDLSDEEKIDLFNLLQISQDVLDRIMHPQGFNIGMNLGRLAGAGIVNHLHFHVVPRWGGDTNFMPIVGNTKVISEALDKTWKHLHIAFEKNFTSFKTNKRGETS